MAAVWPATTVEDTNLNMQIAALRRILDEGRADGSCIQTIPGRGYRCAVPVTRVVADTSARQPSGAPPLPDKPSLAVMPFQNMSGDPEQEYFADGRSSLRSRASGGYSLSPAIPASRTRAKQST